MDERDADSLHALGLPTATAAALKARPAGAWTPTFFGHLAQPSLVARRRQR